MPISSENTHPESNEGRQRSTRARANTFDLKGLFFMFAGPIVVTIAAIGSSIWISHAHASRVDQQTTACARTTASTLSAASQSLLAFGSLDAVQHLVVSAAQGEWITSAQISLPDGRTVATSLGSPTAASLPDTWERIPMSPISLAPSAGGTSATTTAIVPNRGSIIIEVESSAPASMTAGSMIAGVWILAGFAAVALVWTQRWAKQNQRGIAAIRSALLTVSDRGLDPLALSVHPGFGAEAGAWNLVVDRLQRLDEDDIATHASNALSSNAVESRIAQSACGALPIGMLVVGADMRVQLANGAGANLLGLETKNNPDTTFDTSLDDSNCAHEMLNAIHASINGEHVQSTLELERDTDGSRGVLRVLIRRIPQSNPAQVVLLVEDITQQRIAQQSREVFVSHATHELRTPLTNIRLYTETLLDGAADQPMRDQAANVINRESRRLERIVNDMLSVSEMDSGSYALHRDDVRTDQMFSDLEADYVAQAKDKSIALSFDLPPKMPVILGERDKLSMAIHNLIGNAMKYTPVGGTVSVEVQSEPNQLVISVTDSGIGIEETVLPRVFDRFYRAQDDRVTGTSGTGLGLALAREIVRLHGGEITAESVLDEGSTFKIVLPILAQAA